MRVRDPARLLKKILEYYERNLISNKYAKMKMIKTADEIQIDTLKTMTFHELTYMSYLYNNKSFNKKSVKESIDSLRLVKYQPLPRTVEKINILLDCRYSLLFEIDQKLLNKYLNYQVNEKPLAKRFSKNDLYCFKLIGDFLNLLIKYYANEFQSQNDWYLTNYNYIARFSVFPKQSFISSEKRSQMKLWSRITGGSVVAGVVIAAIVLFAISCKNGDWCPMAEHIPDHVVDKINISALAPGYNATMKPVELTFEMNLSLVFIIVSAVALLVMWAYLTFYKTPKSFQFGQKILERLRKTTRADKSTKAEKSFKSSSPRKH